MSLNKEALVLVGRLVGMHMVLSVKALYKTIEAHKGQTRLNGDEYSDHPIRMARMALNFGIKDDIIIASILLHDTVEEGGLTIEEVEKIFGKEVANIVRKLTKTKGGDEEEYFKIVTSELRSIIAKALDIICNIEDMCEVYTKEKIKEKIREAEKYILPAMKMARREYPEYADMLINFRDIIKSILRTAKTVLREMDKNEVLKAKLKKLGKIASKVR